MTTLKWEGKAEMHSHHKSHHSWHSTIQSGEIPNFQLLPEERRIWTTHPGSQLWRLPPEGWASKISSSENQQDWLPRDPKTTASKAAALLGSMSAHCSYPPRAQYTENRRKQKPNHQKKSFPEKGPNAHFTSCCLRVRFLIIVHI